MFTADFGHLNTFPSQLQLQSRITVQTFHVFDIDSNLQTILMTWHF